MLAEIKGKVSRTGSNLSERLEDNLTGNVFGALRYIPFSEGLGTILANAVNSSDIKSCIHQINTQCWANAIEFWPYDQAGELDALITFKDTIIGIEVKYLSGLSSVDEADYIPTEISKHQLARESQIISRKGGGKNNILLFVADRHMCKTVYQDITETKKNILAKDVMFGYVSWQDFLYELKQLNGLDPFQQIIIKDLIDLLTRKRFEDFIDMNMNSVPFVNLNTYFNFDVSHQVEIDFTTNQSIHEELYYEFN
ncbi:hypothetical protein [Exiguobacterium sp. AM39-5BH]|uniref:hypothetical protein n=1 Tax=Exiguobacterium sp. AM39-5BH TaxID=2292355 RepID=UPI000FE1E77F|nr:hypothetical protein [Exiguobacterium sp. AM39-5BH]RHB49258.1 hypothetical protein DW881_08495 [Exiguobacterium sp. AM39-5BH]